MNGFLHALKSASKSLFVPLYLSRASHHRIASLWPASHAVGHATLHDGIGPRLYSNVIQSPRT